MTVRRPVLVSLVSQRPFLVSREALFINDSDGKSKKTSETRFLLALKEVKSGRFERPPARKKRFTSLRRIGWSHWSSGLTYIIAPKFGARETSRDQNDPSRDQFSMGFLARSLR